MDGEVEGVESEIKTATTAAGTTGGLGTGFAVCHAACQSLVAALAIFGVTLVGMPLAFLQPYSTPLLILSAISIVVSLWLIRKHKMPLRILVKPVAIGLVAAFVIFVFAFAVSASYTAGYQSIAGIEQAQSTPSSLPDKCKTPPGYTDAGWREHWGHHPDQFAECLAAIK